MSVFHNKTLLITGGTGSFGHAVVNRFLSTDIGEIRILSRDEKKQDDMRHEYQAKMPEVAGKIKFYIGDVRDYRSIVSAFRGVDYVFHAAALKQVPSCEFYPMEAVKTNVQGSDNVISACVENHVKKAIFLSTDKAAYPINAMGMTKAVMEKNVIARSRQMLPGDPILCLTRYGNVMGSRGSVIPLFCEQIDEGKQLTITNPDMTRFMMTLNDAVDLVLYAFEHGQQGDLFVQKAPAATIGTLAQAILELKHSDAGFDYAAQTGAQVYVYRFPNLFGKWCRPNYNSAVATFCHNMAHDLPIRVNDPATELELLYIDDLVSELLDALEDKAHRCDYDGLTPKPNAEGRYCYVPVTHRVSLGEIVSLLETFKAQPETLLMPEIPNHSFAKKLYSTYLSYLPKEKTAFPLKMNVDARGSFTELLKTENCGQFSVNISKPGITKGQHWHNSKWEFFIVVSGHGLIQERNLNTGERMEFEVSGEKIEAVHMLPGWTHNIINLSESENLVTVMWANEQFDPSHPDTYFEEV